MRKIDADNLIEEIGKLFPNKMPYDYTEEDNDLGAILCEVKEIIDKQPTVDEWIPVEERLPNKEEMERGETTLITVKGERDDGSDDFTMEANYDGPLGGWCDNDCLEYFEIEEVSAWQPTPKPYKRRR